MRSGEERDFFLLLKICYGQKENISISCWRQSDKFNFACFVGYLVHRWMMQPGQ